ncbi:hypothetical protein HMPREF0673_01064 [Leyella stercorea DSM 18206]|jgi:exodeoxyribonuclease VII small subunit|nr:hypothetical protein HMPREF0673_01064 [Leyella stercorea DSM 18206]
MASCHTHAAFRSGGLLIIKQEDMPKEQKYEAAMRQLEDIAAKMENGELDIDSLSEQLKTAQKLIKQCKDKLTKTDEDIRKILGSED